MGSGYFRYEPRNFSYRELARINGAGAWVAWILKTLRLPWGSAWARKLPKSVDDWIVPPETLSEKTSRVLAELRLQMEAVGFESIGVLGSRGSLYPSGSAVEVFRAADGKSIATISAEQSGTIERSTLRILSSADEKFVVTSNRLVLDSPPRVVRKVIREGTPAQLLGAHQIRLTKAGASRRIFPDRAAAFEFFYESEVAEWEWLIKRRVLVECAPEEVETAQRRLSTLGIDPESPNPNPHAATLVEMMAATESNQKARQVGWAFGITLLLFVVAGVLKWETRFLWTLLAALIVHETGHFIVMRAFGYRNLRMIFVPLGGAAVIGQHFNITGWKKAIVSLTGPLPGIFFAAVCAYLAWKNGPNPGRDLTAIIVLVLNGINLLPVFPLDGGNFLNAILFCRNAKWEVTSKTVAAIVLAACAIAFKEVLLGLLAYWMFVTLLPTFRLARMTERLRRETLIPAVNDPNELPLETKIRVIEAVKSAQAKPVNAKILAARALGIFERLNARPPGPAATAGLLVVYIAAIGLSLGSLTTIFGSARRVATAAGPARPKAAWDCNNSPIQIPVLKGERLAAITFDGAKDRGEFTRSLQKEFPTNTSTVIAQTVFVSLSQSQFTNLLKTIRKNRGALVVEPARRRITSSWSFKAPNEETARRIEEEIKNYVEIPAILHAYAPWSPRVLSEINPREKQIRETIRKLSEIQDASDDPIIDKLDSERFEDGPKAREAEFKWRAAVSAYLHNVVFTNQSGFDPAAAAWYTNYLAATNRALFIKGPGEEIARIIGRVERSEDNPSGLISPAVIVRNGSDVHFGLVHFAHLPEGFVTLGNWLCSLDCTNILYILRMQE